jgi:hypothetical protein
VVNSAVSAVCRATIVCLIVIGVGMILGHTARWFADGLAVNAQLYFHAFRIDYVHSPWVLAPLRFLSGAVLQYSALASWSCACGYWCARATTRSTNAWLGAFSLAALLGTVLTTTSVRAAQPWFFASPVAAVIYPAVVKLLFVVIPAWIAVRAIRNQPTPVVPIALVAAIGIVLAWFHASDLGHVLTFGCVIEAGSRSTPCVSGNIPWATGTALALTALSGAMAWDAVRGPLAR